MSALLSGAGVRTASGHVVRPVAPPPAQPRDWHARYEGRLFETGHLAVREGDWHDLFNVLVWMRFPSFKGAINAGHYARLAASGTSSGPRGRERDALTLLDESGCLVVCADRTLIDDLGARRWVKLFWERRAEVDAGMRFFLVGHALLEKGLEPFPAMTARCLSIEVGEAWFEAPEEERMIWLDTRAASRVRDGPLAPHDLPPLPVLGIPGWSPENGRCEFYLNASIFRPPRKPNTPHR